jgi:hypothetical protein
LTRNKFNPILKISLKELYKKKRDSSSFFELKKEKMMYKDLFLNAIQTKQRIRLTFFSKEDGHRLIRKCAPLDYGPSRHAKDKSDRFHFWDYESDTSQHVLSLLPKQIINMELLGESFDPAEFVTWNTLSYPWIVSRDWGQFS